jgi:uncharacterized protein (DUF433 family)
MHYLNIASGIGNIVGCLCIAGLVINNILANRKADARAKDIAKRYDEAISKYAEEALKLSLRTIEAEDRRVAAKPAKFDA